MLSAYTFGKSLDDTSGVRPGGGDTLFVNNPWCNTTCEYARSGYDVRHRWVTSALVELPFGRGRRFGDGMPALVDAIVGNWRLGGILTLESGSAGHAERRPRHHQHRYRRRQPARISSAIRTCPATSARSIAGSGRRRSRSQRRSRSATPAATSSKGQASSTSTCRSPSVSRSGTARSLEFRAEVFNAANHPILGLPNINLSNAAYGRITSTRIDSRQIQLALRFTF